ncbi:unnamed protein product [Rotaria sp. Silwood1]|nr:unnamed protein product [Rotaria sp. Silwood1]
MFYSLNHILNWFCREALYYLFDKFFDLDILHEPFYINHYQSLMKNCSLKWLLLPEYPVLFSFFQFVYLTNQSFNRIEEYIIPDFICFNASQCPKLLFCSINIGIDNGLNCCKRENLINKTLDYQNDLNNIFKDLIEQCSKIVNGYNDCYYKEDEQFSTCQLNDSTRFICPLNFNKCLSMIAVNDGEDEWPYNRWNILINKAPPIGIFCDSENDLSLSNTFNNTDETNCEWWPCNNLYSRCDNKWHCLNGYDELNWPQINCSLNEHKCYYEDYYRYLCISVDHLMEKYSNCDESYINRKIYLNNQTYYNSMNYFLWNKTKCITSKQICLNQSLSYMKDEDIISYVRWKILHMIKEIEKLFLKISRLNSLPSISSSVSLKKSNQFSKIKPIITNIYKKTWYCHRGISLLFKNNSINKCLCPPTYFDNQCQWQNQRISLNRIDINSLTCLCQENFEENKCEKNIQSRIDLEFNEDLIQKESLIYAHFITTFENSEHQSITTLNKIKYGINIITIYIKQPFHILFIEFSNHNYYLTVLRETFIQSEYIKTKIQLNNQCNSVQQIMNSTFQIYSYLHRIKYYPYFCRQYKELMCFYDENYMCLCYNDCQNDDQCFSNNATCPSMSICICSDCFYGSKCQFTTRGFVLSLDYILGYHIKPNISFTHQSSLIKVSVAITTIIFLFGIINGILSILTYRMRKTRDVVLLQMSILTNRSFLTINCILLDGIIRILLATTDWLDGFISMERVIAVIQDVK